MSVVNIQGGRVDGIDVMEVVAGGRAQLLAAARPIGFNALSKRIELKWLAGARGKPSLNANILSTTEAVREIADPQFEVLGVNMTSALSTYYAEGGIVLTTAGADADSAILLAHLDANQTSWEQITWGSDKEVEWECFMQVGGNIGDAVIYAGLKLTNVSVIATDADQIYFRYQNGVNGGRWEAISSIGGVDTQKDTAVAAVAVNDIVHFKIAVDGARIARFYINGVLVQTTAALTDAIDFKSYVGVLAAGAAAAKAIRIFGLAMSRVAG